MFDANTSLFEIGPVPPERRRDALELLHRQVPEGQRAERCAEDLADASGSGAALNGLFEARRNSRLEGVLLARVQPGRMALVWPPQIVSAEKAAAAHGLLAAMLDYLSAHRVRIAQALLDIDAAGDADLLRSGGFQHVADVLFLVALEDQFPTAPPAGGLEFETCGPSNHHRLARIVEGTYENTLDCPRLNGVREIEDVLAGYRAAGNFDPRRWFIVRHQREGVGCLLLTEHQDRNPFDAWYQTSRPWELVYMGLVPSARGRGWGIDMARHALWLAREGGAQRVVLGVDADNTPALRTYAAAGFTPSDRRAVYLKILERVTSGE